MIEVTYVDHMGSDDRVVDAARVSFAKAAESFKPSQNRRLLAYLAEHNHWSPFAHCSLTVHVKAPIFVARQLQKHTVGFAWNEVSRRYVDAPPEIYDPGNWRIRAMDKKQGSGAGVVASPAVYLAFEQARDAALAAYETLLAMNVAPELARAVLPLGTMTEWYWTGSLAAWARMCHQRQAPDAQAEARYVANDVATIAAERFPIS